MLYCIFGGTVMVKMNLTTSKKLDYVLAVDEKECERLVALHDAGEVLYYEYNGGTITFSNGVLSFEGIDFIPSVFCVLSEDDYLDTHSTVNAPLISRVKKIVFAEGTKRITYRAFPSFKKLREVVMPDSVEYIISPFEDCPRLKPYPLPKSLIDISGDAFGIYPDEVVLPEGVEEISGIFNNSSIKSIVLSPSLKEITRRTFYRCTSLERIVFAEGLERIHGEAFSGCTALTELVFPKSLRWIDDFAFAHCTGLTSVKITGDTEIDADAFMDTPFHKEVQRLRFDAFEPIPYTGDVSALPDFDDMKASLSGMPYSEQARFLKLVTDDVELSRAYGSEEWRKHFDNAYPLGDESEVENIIVNEGVIVGAVIRGVTVLLGKRTCIYSASEDDGAGRREVEDYRMIIFVKPI